MANELTGDYKIVAQFTVGAINRVLAGMHSVERFPHSISARVDDSPESPRSVLAGVDLLGRALTDVPLLKRLSDEPQAADSGCGALIARLAPQAGLVVSSPSAPVLELDRFSNLRGAAQIQLGSPTAELPADGSTTATTTTSVLIRYVPDAGTHALPQFCRGVFRTTFTVATRHTPSGSFIEAGPVGDNGGIRFEPFPPGSVDSRSVEAMNKVLRNVLGSGFHPSTSPLPDGISTIDFKAVSGARTLAVMIDSAAGGGATPDPTSVTASFIRGGDFAVGVNGDLIARQFATAVNDAVPDRASFEVKLGFLNFGVGVNATIQDARVQLTESGGGQILLTIPVRVQLTGDTLWLRTNFGFSLTQGFALSLDGSRIRLSPVGGLSLDLSEVPGEIAGRLRDEATNLFNSAWRDNQATIQSRLNEAFAGANLQQIVGDLLNPPHVPTPLDPGPAPIYPRIAYTSVEIRRAGVILHGTVELPEWPAVRAEFDLDPWTASTGRQDYSALNSWVPGGNISSFAWSFGAATEPARSDSFLASTATLERVCLKVTGSRISPSGPVTVSNPFASRCHLIDTGAWSIPVDIRPALRSGLPTIAHIVPAIQQEGTLINVVGHSSPWTDPAKSYTVNLLVHFTDEKAAAPIEVLAAALSSSGRTDTETRIVCVLSAEHLRKTPKPSTGVVLLSDDVDAWKRLFDVAKGPETVLLSPAGKVEWRQKGFVDAGKLAAALKAHLAKGGYARPYLVEPLVRVGQLAPDFIFETGVGNSRSSIRKLAGREAILVFWRDSAPSSIDTIQRLEQSACRRPGGTFPPILAIHDGKGREVDCSSIQTMAPQLKDRVAGQGTENWLRHTTLIPDPDRRIAQAYGVSVWPTIVMLGKDGRIQDIRLQAIAEEELNPRSGPVVPPPPPKTPTDKDC